MWYLSFSKSWRGLFGFGRTLVVAFLIFMLPASSVLAASTDDMVTVNVSLEKMAVPSAEEESLSDNGLESVTEKVNDTAEIELAPPSEPVLEQNPASSLSTYQASSTQEFNSQAEDPVRNEDTDTTYPTIQAAIDAPTTLPGHTIAVGAGTYVESVTINKSLTLIGTNGDSIISQPNTSPGVTIAANNTTLQGFTIEKGGVGSVSGCLAGGAPSSGNGLTFSGILITDTTLSDLTVTGATNGLRVGGSTTLDGLNISDSHFDGNCVGWYLSKESASSNPADVTNVVVSNTTFSNNQTKGIYAEKLSNATFDNITVSGSGVDPVYGFNAGIDINLKWMAYDEIHITNSVISGSGLMGSASNALFPAGITVKARDDAPSYSTPAASLDNVSLTNVDIAGGVVGLRLGEPGKNNAGPTNVIVDNSVLSGTGGYGLVNQSTVEVTATHNWWGATDPAAVAGSIEDTGPVVYEPYCADSTCDTVYVDPAELDNTTLDGAEIAVPDGATIENTPSIEFLEAFQVTVGSSSVFIPAGTTITQAGGGSFDATLIDASSPGTGAVSGLGSSTVVDGVLQWGLNGLGLNFSPAITIEIFVGTSLNGQTLDIMRSVSGSSSWTSDGISAPKTCVVSAGICQFKATKASYYAVGHQATSTSSTPSVSSSSGYGPVAYASFSQTPAIATPRETAAESTPEEAASPGEVQAVTDSQDGDIWWWTGGILAGLALLYLVQRNWSVFQKRTGKATK